MWATSVLTPSVFVVLTFISPISNAQVNDCLWPSIPNSQRNCTDDNRYSSVCNYTCDTGYELDGNSSVQCTANKTWSDQPSCLIINCTWPTIPNSQRNCTDDNRYSSVCTYTCDTGYELDGNSSVQCTANKTWSDEPSCPITHCSSEPDVSNSYRFCTNANEYKSVCSYTCKTGYELRGVPIVTCLATETWTPEPSCPKISCAWPTIPNSKRSCTDSNRYSSVCTYTCDTGYELQGSPTAKCNADKTWSNQPACTKRVRTDDKLKKVLVPVIVLIVLGIIVIVLYCMYHRCRNVGRFRSVEVGDMPYNSAPGRYQFYSQSRNETAPTAEDAPQPNEKCLDPTEGSCHQDECVESNDEHSSIEGHQASSSGPSQSSGKASQGRFGAGSHWDHIIAIILLELESAADRSRPSQYQDECVESNEEHSSIEGPQASSSRPSQSSGKASQGRFGAGSHWDHMIATFLLELESAADRSNVPTALDLSRPSQYQDECVESNSSIEGPQASSSRPSQSSGKASQGRFGAGSHCDHIIATFLLELESAADRSNAPTALDLKRPSQYQEASPRPRNDDEHNRQRPLTVRTGRHTNPIKDCPMCPEWVKEEARKMELLRRRPPPKQSGKKMMPKSNGKERRGN